MGSLRTYNNLIEMQETCCKLYRNRELFGTKVNGNYQWITYSQFAEYIDHLRGALKLLGVGPKDTVAVISRNCTEWAVACYATLGLKAKYTSMYETQTQEDWEYIIRDSEAKVLFVHDDDIYKKVKDFPSSISSLKKIINFSDKSKNPQSYWEQIRVGQANPTPSLQPSNDDLMGLIYTSGTTGKPKGVMLSHGNILANLNMIPETIKFADEERTLSFLPWAHIFGQTGELHLIIFAGLSTGFAEDVSTIIENLAEVRPTVLFSVPRIFNRIYDGVQTKMNDRGGAIKWMFDKGLELAKKKKKSQLKLSEEVLLKLIDSIVFKKVRERFGGRLKFAISGASALNPSVAEFIDNLGIVVLEGYGLSETSPVISINTFEYRKIGTVGKPLNNVRVVIDQKVIEGENTNRDGEIIAYGPNVMKGYYKLPEETEKVMTSDGGFRTGDLGHFDSEGFLVITGRIKEQYKLENGKYVVPGVIEEQLQLSPYINQAYLYGSDKPYNIALIVGDSAKLKKYLEENHQSFNQDEILSHPKTKQLIQEEIERCLNKIKSYERPKNFAIIGEEFSVANGLLTPSMKVKRRPVFDRYKSLIETLY